MIKTFSPFARAYSPALANLPDPISHDQFIDFIDGLNSAFISSPIFQMAHIVGGTLLGTQILPAQVVGGVFQVAYEEGKHDSICSKKPHRQDHDHEEDDGRDPLQ